MLGLGRFIHGYKDQLSLGNAHAFIDNNDLETLVNSVLSRYSMSTKCLSRKDLDSMMNLHTKR